jgi:hypothetical protein
MKTLFALLLSILLCASAAWAGDVGFNLDLHIGSQPMAPITVSEPPLFLTPPELGFQVAVGAVYDMFRIDGRFYLCREGRWYAASRYDGPWQGIGPKHLPPGLAKKRYRDVLRLRDAEYAHYRKARKQYNGKLYRPEKSNPARGKGRGKNKNNKNKQ